MAKRKGKTTLSIGDQLRQFIRDSDIVKILGVRGLALRAGVDSGLLYRFLAGQRDMTCDTADRVCRCLNLVLVQHPRNSTETTPPPA